MKPLNYSDPGCNPVSSNCVIWQGPDIPCIKLCKGDSISEVINKLAIELCNIMDTMNVTSYDLECLNLACCEPQNFKDLIQLLINQICIIQGGTPNNTKVISSSASGIVDIAPCFYYVNPLGDTVTKMTTEEYATALGNRVCTIVTQILTINSTLSSFNTRITILENTPPPTLTLPQVTPTCVLPSVPTDMNIVLDALEDQFCQLREVTGTPLELSGSLLGQCVTSSDNKLSSAGTMGSLPGWVITPTLVSDTISNLWLTLCDVRSAVRNIQLTCCPSGCDGISLNVTMDVTGGGGTLSIYLTGTIPSEFIECGGGGSLFTVSDGINSTTISINVKDYLNNPLGFSVSFPFVLNPSANLTISSTVCLFNPTTGTTCSNCISYTYQNTESCPELTLTQDLMSPLDIDWSFTVVTPGIYTLELYTAADVFISSTSAAYGAGAQSGTFTTAAYGSYKVRIVQVIGGNTINCPFVSITTSEPPIS